MGFKSVMKKIGHVALKTAPIWMSVVPGVGTAAGIALSAAASAADKKLSGGSWKSSLLSGGLGAGEAVGGHFLGKGIEALKHGKDAAGASKLLSGGSGFSDALSDTANIGTGATNAPLFGVGSAGKMTSRAIQSGGPGTVDTEHGTQGGSTSESIAHKLFSDPKTYYAALSMLQGDSNSDNRRAYKPGEWERNVEMSRKALGIPEGFNYRSTPAPVIAGSSQIGGGMDTTEAERRLAEQENGRG